MQNGDLRFDIGGVVVSLRGGCREWISPPEHPYYRFTTTLPVDIIVDLAGGEEKPPPADAVLVGQGSKLHPWRLYASQDRLIFEDRFLVLAPTRIVRRYCAIDHTFQRGHILLPSNALQPGQSIPLRFQLDFFLVANYLVRHDGGALVHAASVGFDDGGILLSGSSGAGKTTLARLCRSEGARVLNHDVSSIRRSADGRIRVHATPWWVEDPTHSAPRGIPLRAVCFLEHGTQNHLASLTPQEAVSRLVSQCLSPVFYDPNLVANLLDFCTSVAESVPVYKLAFRPDRDVVALLGVL